MKLHRIAAAIALMAAPAHAQKTAEPVVTTLSYADTADLALGAPIVAQIRVRNVDELRGKLAPGLATGARRYLVEADVLAVIRGQGGLPPRITYITDVRPTGDGKWPKLRKKSVIVFGTAVAGKPASIRLIAPDAQQSFTPEFAARVRAVLQEANSASAPPQVTAVGQAFHVPGTIQGEGETQIFLKAHDGRPLSLSVWRNPGTAPRWAVSLGEIVDESAAPPARDTLLWYRLACFLPPRLPAESVSDLDAERAQIASEDYATIMAGLGPCARTRGTGNPARNS